MKEKFAYIGEKMWGRKHTYLPHIGYKQNM